jgi:hypothetical protein
MSISPGPFVAYTNQPPARAAPWRKDEAMKVMVIVKATKSSEAAELPRQMAKTLVVRTTAGLLPVHVATERGHKFNSIEPMIRTSCSPAKKS